MRIVNINDLKIDQQIQLRKRWIDESTVQAYVEALSSGAEFPPIIAFDDGEALWVADGFHRLAAYRFCGLAEIETDVRPGTRKDAMIYAAHANAKNAKPMDQEQRREAIKRLLKLTNWSQREIARKLAINHATVSRLANSLSVANATDIEVAPRAIAVNRGGTAYEMDASNIGREQSFAPPHLPRSWQTEEKDYIPPTSIEQIENEEVFKSCQNCAHAEGDPNSSSDQGIWCHARRESVAYPADNAPRCGLELWQDNGTYLEEVMEWADAYIERDDSQWPASIELLCGDFAEIGPQLEAESFDTIITDPPYGGKHTHLYELLAMQAKRLLKPGGSLLTMAGQTYLPDVLNLMTPHLAYHWTVSYDTPGGQSPQIWPRKVNTFWKPVLWFTKGEYNGVWHGDKIKSDTNDKRFHGWGQSESGIGRLISEFAFGGGRVLDPFVGGGTTAVVCYRLRIPCTGIDIDKDAIDTTRNRIIMELNG